MRNSTKGDTMEQITVNDKEIAINRADYPARYRMQEIFQQVAEENGGCTVKLISGGHIIGWRKDEVKK